MKQKKFQLGFHIITTTAVCCCLFIVTTLSKAIAFDNNDRSSHISLEIIFDQYVRESNAIHSKNLTQEAEDLWHRDWLVRLRDSLKIAPETSQIRNQVLIDILGLANTLNDYAVSEEMLQALITDANDVPSKLRWQIARGALYARKYSASKILQDLDLANKAYTESLDSILIILNDSTNLEEDVDHYFAEKLIIYARLGLLHVSGNDYERALKYFKEGSTVLADLEELSTINVNDNARHNNNQNHCFQSLMRESPLERVKRLNFTKEWFFHYQATSLATLNDIDSLVSVLSQIKELPELELPFSSHFTECYDIIFGFGEDAIQAFLSKWKDTVPLDYHSLRWKLMLAGSYERSNNTDELLSVLTEILSEESGNILRQHERQHFISGQGGLLAETMFMAAKVYSQKNMSKEVREIHENFATIFPNDTRLATIEGMIGWMESNPDFYTIPISKTSWRGRHIVATVGLLLVFFAILLKLMAILRPSPTDAPT